MEVRILSLSKKGGWLSVNVSERISVGKMVFPDKEGDFTGAPPLVRNLIGTGIGITDIVLMPYEVQIFVTGESVPVSVVHRYIRAAIIRSEPKSKIEIDIGKTKDGEALYISIPRGLVSEKYDGIWWNISEVDTKDCPEIVVDLLDVGGVTSVQTFHDELMILKGHCFRWKSIASAAEKAIRFRLRLLAR
ncbi:MAG: hypothetical protein PHG66_03940 [Candidatus Colwellbacteria bacterium]|nr:hypothetical protein [Candidatus Colwellbacteria bacterium]